MGEQGDDASDSLKKEAAIPQRPSPESAPDYELPEILRGNDPRVILNRLVDEDPFEISARCARRAREEAVIVNPARLILNSMGRIALGAASYAGTEPIEEWVEVAIEVSLFDLLEEQREEERRGLPVEDSPDAPFYTSFADIVGIDAVDGRLACLALNGMSSAHRQAFHAVILGGTSVERWAEDTGMRPKRVYELLREVGLEVNGRVLKRRKARRRKRL